MNFIKRFLYGILIGVTSIAPGISGGTIAIALGFYESLIHAIANLLKQFKKNFSYLFPYGLGAVISIATLSVVLEYLFERFPLPTNTLFIGLILGTIPFIKGKLHTSLEGHKLNIRHILTGLIFFLIVLIPVFTSESDITAMLTWDPESGTGSVLLFFIIGAIIAATLIIPGLSGTMILMSLGFYQPLLSTVSTCVTAAATLNIAAIAGMLDTLIPIGLGVAIGAFMLAKVLDKMFSKIPSYIYSAIFALICATPIVMLAEIPAAEFTLINIVVSIITLIAGLLLVKKLGSNE